MRFDFDYVMSFFELWKYKIISIKTVHRKLDEGCIIEPHNLQTSAEDSHIVLKVNLLTIRHHKQ